jgi:hypothetical protein
MFYMYKYVWIISYYIRVRSLSYIVFDYGVNNEIITQKKIVIGHCKLLKIVHSRKWNKEIHPEYNMSTLTIYLD